MLKKVLLSMLVLVLILLAGGIYWTHTPNSQPEKSTVKPDLTATVQRLTILKTVNASGDIEPETKIEIKAEVGARILKLHVKLGDIVKEAQLLVELDDRELTSQKNSNELEVQAAKFRLERSTRDRQRAQILFEKNAISSEAYQLAQTDLDLAKNDYLRAQSQLEIAEDRLSKTRIKAPQAGKILELPVVEGQVVVPAASVNAGTVLMSIADLGKMLISTHVNQIDIASLHTGMPISFNLDSIREKTFHGTIKDIAPMASIKNNVKGFQVKVHIDTLDPLLRPGMTANIEANVGEAKDVLAVPLSAVFVDPDGKKVAFVKSPGTGEPQKREVKIGLSNIEFVEIKSGLQDQETVLLTRPVPQGG